jgi:hypothetical protein
MKRGQHQSIWRLLWRAVDLTALLPLVISLCALQGTMAGARAAPSDPSKPPQSAGIYDPDLNHTDEEGNGLSINYAPQIVPKNKRQKFVSLFSLRHEWP